jgi:hypothetical protein
LVAGASVAYGLENVVVQKARYFMGNTNITFLEGLMWVLATQFLGFGMAGLARRFLVEPKQMIWPSILSSVALFHSFYDPPSKYDSMAGLSRFRFFWIATLVLFVYTWIPQYFFVTLQSFSLLCFMTSNRTVRFLASSSNGYGVGLGALTLDFYYIGGDC